MNFSKFQAFRIRLSPYPDLDNSLSDSRRNPVLNKFFVRVTSKCGHGVGLCSLTRNFSKRVSLMCKVASRSREPRATIACLFLRATFFDVFHVLRFLDIYKSIFHPLDRALAYLLLKTYLVMIIKMIGSIEACTVFTRLIFTRDLLDRFFFLAPGNQ